MAVQPKAHHGLTTFLAEGAWEQDVEATPKGKE